jgi:hypothetical protein
MSACPGRCGWQPEMGVPAAIRQRIDCGAGRTSAVTPEEMGDCRDHGTQSKGELSRSAMQSELWKVR